MNAISAQEAFMAARDYGFHVYGHLLGIWCRNLGNGTCEGSLELASFMLDERGMPALGVIATLGDMAMQSALLERYPERRLTTRTLGVRRLDRQECRELRARARLLHAGPSIAMSETIVENEHGVPVAAASATFVPITPPGGWRPLPWEADAERPRREQVLQGPPLGDDERHASLLLEDVLAHPGAGYRELLGLAKGIANADGSVGWRLQPHLLNRAKEAQGGAIFGALGEAARGGLPEGAIPIEQTVTFFRPVREDVVIDVEMLHSSRRFATAATRMRYALGGLAAASWNEYELEK